MSAAESADHVMPALGDRGETAAVIDLTTRNRRPGKGRRKHVSTPQPAPGPAGDKDPQAQLAEHIEITFNHHRLSLTDEATRTAYTVTLQIVRDILRGAEAQGIVDARARRELDDLVRGMTGAPELIEHSG